MARPVVALMVVLAVFLGGAGPAAAHAGPLATSPGNLETVGGEVREVMLVFDEPLTAATFEVTAPGGSILEGRTDLGEANRAVYRFDPLGIEGRHVVQFAVEFADGATFDGTFLFNYDPSAPAPLLVSTGSSGGAWSGRLVILGPVVALVSVGAVVEVNRRRRAGLLDPAAG